ncbi:MAG: EAL domain-containing protein [Acidobacteriota bacterium]
MRSDTRPKARSERETWYLEGFVDERRQVWRTAIDRLPFRIGRRSDADLPLASPRVSGRHAEIRSREGILRLHDVGSKNGTFVNGAPVTQPVELEDGDVLHFANQELRLLVSSDSPLVRTTLTLAISERDLAAQLAQRLDEFEGLLERRDLVAVFQPLVELGPDRRIIGYEALGRGTMEGREVSPFELFLLADCIDAEAPLSEALRAVALASAHQLPNAAGIKLFLNIHPAELRDGPQPFLRSLKSTLAENRPPCDLVLELHESAVADGAFLRELSSGLDRLGVEIAFDDFGAGQARLQELAEVAPQFVKFDRGWLRDLDQASDSRLSMIRQLVAMVKGLDIATLAEGVETETEAELCTTLGFQLAQGFYFGRPMLPGGGEVSQLNDTFGGLLKEPSDG